MKCVVCSQDKIREEVVVLSYGAFSQIGPLLSKDNGCGSGDESNSAVYVCKMCFLTAYKPQKSVSPAT